MLGRILPEAEKKHQHFRGALLEQNWLCFSLLDLIIVKGYYNCV